MEHKEQTVTLTWEEWQMVDIALLVLRHQEEVSAEAWKDMAKECREDSEKFSEFAAARDEEAKEIQKTIDKIREERYGDHSAR